ncbi:MAG: 2-C-methyl-D-erythritol 2,4-cyclodiphosphate synthase [Arenicellales bacterium]|jgi:2-C-methyl-D-erythritol 2,4-cyclodiphosphate synthase
MNVRIGNGFDVHRLVAGRPLILGGVEIDWGLGLEGHSDADVLLHALCDALLGAAGMGDIGKHFPPSDEDYRDMDSREFIRTVAKMLLDANFSVGNVDCTIIAERPRLAPYTPEMVTTIAADLGIAENCINVKATTSEGLGYCGREEGIAASVSVLIETKGGLNV